jgi:hypothetical protein
VEQIEGEVSPKTGLENTQRIPQPKMAIMRNTKESSGFMVGATGFEPVTSTV